MSGKISTSRLLKVGEDSYRLAVIVVGYVRKIDEGYWECDFGGEVLHFNEFDAIKALTRAESLAESVMRRRGVDPFDDADVDSDDWIPMTEVYEGSFDR